MSNEHLSVNGTLIQAWASPSRSSPTPDAEPPVDDGPGTLSTGRNAARNRRGRKRSDETHTSTTDPDAASRKSKGQASIMAGAGHVRMENRNGLVVQSSHATGTAEPAALALVDRMAPGRRIWERTKAPTSQASPPPAGPPGHAACRRRWARVDGGSAAWLRRGQAPDEPKRLRRRPARAQTDRGVSGWIKGSGSLRQTQHRGRARVGWQFDRAITASNLIRLPKRLEAVPA